MADVDMEVDEHRPLGAAELLDEDLIDYDTDMADQPEPEWSKRGGVEKASSFVAGDDGHEIDDFENIEELDAVGQINGEVDDGHNTMDKAEEYTDDITNLAEPDYIEVADDTEAAEGEDGSNAKVIDNPDDHDHPAGHDDNESAHEIDYDHDAHEEEELQDELDADIGGDLLDVGAKATGNADDADGHTKPVDDTTVGEDSHNSNHAAEVEEAQQDEITWDEYEDHEFQEGEENDEQKGAETIAHDNVSDQHDDETTANDEGTGHDQEEDLEDSDQPTTGQHEELSHSTEPDEHENIEETYEENQERAISQQGVLSTSREESAAASDPDFPAITVQYKGDEFPFFSTATEGFFTEASCLDDTMETLLAKLHEELANEIAHEDELVFQVDELGLEFAESSSHDSLSGVTLRQILEIFDLLVKNQDPDSSRTLYTYLFTKPSTSKRLESLIDSATAGKGLDEVIHLFESPMPNSTVMLGASSVVQDIDEHLDEYDSPDDEIIESNYLELDQGDEVVAEDEEEHGLADTEAGADGDQNDAAVRYDDRHDIEKDEVERTTESDGYAPDSAAMFENVESNAPTESEPNPFVNLELDDTVEVGDNDAELGKLDEDYDAHKANVANPATANTSTTNTLRDDDDAASINVDIGAEVGTNDAKENTITADDDELAEIDWREDDEAPETPSGTGKRSRAHDDELGAENEKDVKRRRP